MFGPLKFMHLNRTSPIFHHNFHGDHSAACMLCDVQFSFPSKQDEFFTHLFDEHKLVIADAHLIASLKSYIDYWRVRFSSNPIEKFCSTMLLDGIGPGQDRYFLLSDVIQEDGLLRKGLQMKRLEWILDQQAQERSSIFSRECLFCRTQFNGSRSDYFTHLSEKHNLQLGCPENLVFSDELLNTIEDKMNRLQCLFCEKHFKHRAMLKEHMRKKQHKRINPDNKAYDRFYVINYLEMGKTWQQVQNEPEEMEHIEDVSDWTDWQDMEESETYVVCLYCEKICTSFEDVLVHMITLHNFNYEENCTKLNLNFYQQVKVVNYIRRQMYSCRCVNCNEKLSSRDDILRHMKEENHFAIPSAEMWDQPEYYFPTYENDNFLCYLDDMSDASAEDEPCATVEHCCKTSDCNEDI